MHWIEDVLSATDNHVRISTDLVAKSRQTIASVAAVVAQADLAHARSKEALERIRPLRVAPDEDTI